MNMQNCSTSEYVKISLFEEIRERIKDKPGLTQSALAEKLGVTREHLNRMLSNKYPMKVEILIYLMTTLEIKGLPTR